MKLTEQHLSEEVLDAMIERYSNQSNPNIIERWHLDALLELKQRREEDRQCNFLSQALNEGYGVYRP